MTPKPTRYYSAFVFVFGFFNFLSPSKLPFSKLLYATWNLFTSFWWITVAIFLDRNFALTKHMCSWGSGKGGLPSRGSGRILPSSKKNKSYEDINENDALNQNMLNSFNNEHVYNSKKQLKKQQETFFFYSRRHFCYL